MRFFFYSEKSRVGQGIRGQITEHGIRCRPEPKDRVQTAMTQVKRLRN